ncbi:hypothetical protein QYE76_049076 [Lolium multiflorum]|uniref:Uncharacterized protein n=1 Tax=Lolium multiflorum TaxID=4521 RepID=A0AAD8SNX3_LOLMU|nr:hypothetical protein QYE76_049076 [Lolium multiflorum]
MTRAHARPDAPRHARRAHAAPVRAWRTPWTRQSVTRADAPRPHSPAPPPWTRQTTSNPTASSLDRGNAAATASPQSLARSRRQAGVRRAGGHPKRRCYRGILVLDNDAAHLSDDPEPSAPSDPLLPPLTVGLHWEAKLMGRGAHTRMEPYVQTETYDLENGGSLVFERDLYLVSERLERPPPKFHGVRIHDTPTGEQQWMITADLKGSSEPPISERILFSFKACNWPDGLAHALQEGLARVCGQNIAALRGSRFAYFARHDTMGEPMALSSHPVLKIHVQHLDFMLHETRKELELTRVHNHRAQMTLAHHAEAIRMLAKDRKSLRLQRAKKDATISRLREKIRTLEVTIRTQQDQIQAMEEDGDDIQGGDDFLSDDNDFEDDEFTDEEDYAFLESEEDGIIPIDVDEE